MYVIEYLTLYRLLFFVLPRILWSKISGKESQFYFIDASPVGAIGRKIVRQLSFRLVDVRDEKGLLIRLRVSYKDIFQAQREIVAQPAFAEYVKTVQNSSLISFLSKEAVRPSITDRKCVYRAMLLVEICAWYARQSKNSGPKVLFLNSRPWLHVIEDYAKRTGVRIIPWVSLPRRSDLQHSLLPPWVFFGLQSARNRLFHLRFLRHGIRRSKQLTMGPARSKLALEYVGQLNLDRPECHSDFFFWQQSAIPGKDVVVTCALPQDPIDENKAAAFAKYRMTPIALHSLGTTLPSVPLFTCWPKSIRRHGIAAHLRTSPEGKWIDQGVRQYFAIRDYWSELFQRANIGLFVSWQRFDGVHCAIHDAMRQIGGVTAIYQRAFQIDPAAEIGVNADIMFGYSRTDAEVERQSGSEVAYHVATGYQGDHRFAMMRDMAAELRARLQKNGAEFILAFFDENSGPDERWHTGNRFQAENYAFLLEKLLAEPRLGLIFKPKVPATLRRRIGAVSDLLEKAIQTGRCHVYEGGAIQGTYPPALAALSADVAIHGHLCAGTAGFEAALTGVRTLLLDREGWSVSPLYALGVGRVVFRNWPEFWNALEEYRRSPERLPGFGDWSPIINELDPFRDGRAAERMGTYLHWLLEGLKAGEPHERVLADAADRYGRAWGYDKITQLNKAASFDKEHFEELQRR